jgi:nitrilase
MSRTLRVAALQMVSSARVEANLSQAAELIWRAVDQGARLVALPEFFCLMGRETDKLEQCEADGRGPIQDFLAAQAHKHSIWLAAGTVPLEAGQAGRVYNALLVFDPSGRRIARYDKIHLFAFSTPGESYDEAGTIAPGSQVITFQLAPPCGSPLTVGLSVCYDLRFPELYRAMPQPDLILVPAAFTATTGRAHWEVLLRARAIENLCYVLAPAQGGQHEDGRATYGHSMLVDPWGRILAQRDSGAGVVLGEVDPARIAALRASLPALSHRTLP